MDKEALKKFYFSGASNFTAFNKSGTNRSNISNVDVSGVDASAVTHNNDISTADSRTGDTLLSLKVGSSNVSVPTRSNPNSSVGKAVASENTDKGPGSASHISAIRSIAQQNQLSALGAKPNGPKSRSVAGSHNPPPDAASAEYFAFLRQQQDLSKGHGRIDDALQHLQQYRQERQSEVVKLRRSCLELLRDVEENSDWKLRSKYDVQQLIKDCNLSLQPTELSPNEEPDLSGVDAVADGLEALKRQYQSSLQFAPYKLTVDQALRRLSTLKSTLKDGNADYTQLARVADTLLVQFSSNCELSTLEGLIQGNESTIDACTSKVEDMRAKREAAVADGEVHIAEKLCYDIISQYEALLEQVIAKSRTLGDATKENQIVDQVRKEYHGAVHPSLEQLRTRQGKLRNRCEEDIKKMMSLREKVEEVEASTSTKVQAEREASDKLLAANGERIQEVFVKMAELELELEQLERERHREFQKRLAEKDKDEHRRAEYAKFCSTLEAHLAPLERTIKNADLMVHACDVFEELINNGFNEIGDDLHERGKLLKDVKLESHKEHVEVFRAVLLELGEIIYRKERMMEELDKKIQQAHVQQELLAETFNPNARKFGEMKKSLLASRDELEEDVEELKKRAEEALANFRNTEISLNEAGVAFVHPVTEQELHTTAMRGKMLEFKAMVAGHNKGSSALMDGIEQLQSELAVARSEIDSANADTTGMVSRAIPIIRASNKVRLGAEK